MMWNYFILLLHRPKLSTILHCLLYHWWFMWILYLESAVAEWLALGIWKQVWSPATAVMAECHCINTDVFARESWTRELLTWNNWNNVENIVNLKNKRFWKIYYILSLTSEIPLEFTKELEDTKTYEKSTVTLTCELNKPKKTVKWTKNGKVVRSTKSSKISVDVYTHQIVFTDITLEDAGKYVCACGSVSTTATLTVSGELSSEYF